MTLMRKNKTQMASCGLNQGWGGAEPDLLSSCPIPGPASMAMGLEGKG